jgi:hypothetical protein
VPMSKGSVTGHVVVGRLTGFLRVVRLSYDAGR